MTEFDDACSILPGQTLLSFTHDTAKDKFILLTETHRVVLGCEGDCCANAYFTDLEIASDLPAKITAWEDTPGDTTKGEYGDCLDTSFVKIKTDRGYIDFSLHVSHNGYYGGWYQVEVLTSHKCPTCEAALIAKPNEFNCTGCGAQFSPEVLGKISDSMHRLQKKTA